MNVIGRIAAIEYQGKCYLARVIDMLAGTSRPKRMRIQNDPFLQDTVVMPGQYTFKCWTDEEDY